MMAIILQDELIAELEEILKPLMLKNKDGKLRHIKVYPQYLPVAGNYNSNTDITDSGGFDFHDFDNEYESLFPFIVVYLESGTVQSGVMAHSISVGLAIGVYDNDDNRQGYRDILLIISKILERFEKNNILAKKFIADFPAEWSLQEPGDITCPCFYGSLVLNFDTATYRRECIRA